MNHLSRITSSAVVALSISLTACPAKTPSAPSVPDESHASTSEAVTFSNEVTSPRAREPIPMPPASLQFSEGGTISMTIAFDGTTLRKRQVGGFGPQQGEDFGSSETKPSLAAWAIFESALTSIGVWTWPERFTSAHSQRTDGVGWSLKIAAADGRVFTTAGYNASPKGLTDLKNALNALSTPP